MIDKSFIQSPIFTITGHEGNGVLESVYIIKKFDVFSSESFHLALQHSIFLCLDVVLMGPRVNDDQLTHTSHKVSTDKIESCLGTALEISGVCVVERAPVIFIENVISE